MEPDYLQAWNRVRSIVKDCLTFGEIKDVVGAAGIPLEQVAHLQQRSSSRSNTKGELLDAITALLDKADERRRENTLARVCNQCIARHPERSGEIVRQLEQSGLTIGGTGKLLLLPEGGGGSLTSVTQNSLPLPTPTNLPAPTDLPQAGKPKLAIPLSDPNAKVVMQCFQEGRPIDPSVILRSARLHTLTDADKGDFIVIKFAYALLNGKKIAVFSRSSQQHSNKVYSDSILLSAGIDVELAAINGEQGLITNSYYPITNKLGAYVNELEMPAMMFEGFEHPQRFSAFAFRQDGNRYYAFFIHFPRVIRRHRFPRQEFFLAGGHGDEFKGFFALDEAADLMRETDLLADRFALAVQRNSDYPKNGIVCSAFRRTRLFGIFPRIRNFDWSKWGFIIGVGSILLTLLIWYLSKAR